MKKLLLFALGCMMAFSMNAQRIAVLEFNAGSNISRADVEGISAIFNTYFSPQGYTLVERTRIDRIIDEQGFQRGSFTQDQMVRIGQLLNVSRVVVGDVNYAFKQYNVDVRVVNVESATIAAKAGTTWEQGASYRKMMKALAEDLAQQVSIIPVETKPAPPVHYTTNAEKLGISMYDGRYVRNGQFISKKDVRSLVVQDIYDTQDFASQVRFHKNKILIWSGWGTFATGQTLMALGTILWGIDGFEDGELGVTGISLLAIGGTASTASVPILCVGYSRRDGIVNDYLNAPVRQKPTTEFRLQASQNGVGFAIAF